MQAEEIIDKSKEVLSIGEKADITTVGVLLGLCVILGIIAYISWKDKKGSEKDQKELNIKTLTALTEANIIIGNLDSKVKDSNDKIVDLKLLITTAIGDIRGDIKDLRNGSS